MIQHAAYNHGLWYHYRLHVPRSQSLLTDFPSLHSFLSTMSSTCPHDKFLSGPRSSKLRIPVPVQLTELRGHELCAMAAASLTFSKERTPHTKVELGLLHADEKTICVEIPLWLHAQEHDQYEAIFNVNGPHRYFTHRKRQSVDLGLQTKRAQREVGGNADKLLCNNACSTNGYCTERYDVWLL
jgi:hypothetical protein